MAVRVLFFASVKEAVGHAMLDVDVREPASLETLLEALAVMLPDYAMAELRSESVRLAINQRLVRPPVQLMGDDEVAFLPRVTGG
jgi:molybdopterin synthase sulfur carrier subunit